MSVEAGAWLGFVIVVMAMNVTTIHCDEIIYQFPESGNLIACSSVSWFPRCVQPPDIADADTMGIMAITMRSSSRDRSATFDGSVKSDNVVIAYILPAISVGGWLSVPGPDLFSANIDFRFC